MKKINILFLFAGLVALVGCANNDELINDDGVLPHSVLSRSISTTYYLDGADNLYTGSPEIFTVKSKDGSALPVSLKTTWNYPSDLYRVSYDDTSITFGRKLAVGTYQIIGTLNNGQVVSKNVTAIDSYKPDGEKPSQPNNPTPESLEQVVAKSIYMTPLEVSDGCCGPYEDIDAFRYINGNHYSITTGSLHVKVLFQNKSNSLQTIKCGQLTISYGNSVQYKPESITDKQYSYFSQITLSANSSIEAILHLGNEWYEASSSMPVTQLLPYYSTYVVSSPGYGYLFSK